MSFAEKFRNLFEDPIQYQRIIQSDDKLHKLFQERQDVKNLILTCGSYEDIKRLMLQQYLLKISINEQIFHVASKLSEVEDLQKKND